MNNYAKFITTLAVILFVSCDKNNEEIAMQEPLTFQVSRYGAFGLVDEKLTINASTTDYSIDFIISVVCMNWQNVIVYAVLIVNKKNRQ